jgi:hypothetical protein
VAVPDRLDPEIAAIIAVRHDEPLSFIGTHQTADGVVVRTSAGGGGARCWRSRSAALAHMSA